MSRSLYNNDDFLLFNEQHLPEILVYQLSGLADI
jgi:hypothetical protein